MILNENLIFKILKIGFKTKKKKISGTKKKNYKSIKYNYKSYIGTTFHEMRAKKKKQITIFNSHRTHTKPSL